MLGEADINSTPDGQTNPIDELANAVELANSRLLGREAFLEYIAVSFSFLILNEIIFLASTLKRRKRGCLAPLAKHSSI